MLMVKVTVVQLMTCLVMVGSGLGSTLLVVVGRCPGSWSRGSFCSGLLLMSSSASIHLHISSLWLLPSRWHVGIHGHGVSSLHGLFVLPQSDLQRPSGLTYVSFVTTFAGDFINNASLSLIWDLSLDFHQGFIKACFRVFTGLIPRGHKLSQPSCWGLSHKASWGSLQIFHQWMKRRGEYWGWMGGVDGRVLSSPGPRGSHLKPG